MKKLFYFTLFSALCLLAGLGSCRKKQPDPCAGKKPFQADFEIFQSISISYPGKGRFIEDRDTLIILNEDTVFSSYAPINFRAKEEYDTYLWKVGEDERTWNTSAFSLNFAALEGKFEVTLIATKAADPCFPNNKIVDTVRHWFYSKRDYFPFPSPFPSSRPFEGVWRGAFADTPNDVFDVHIQPVAFPGGKIQIQIWNFPKGYNLDYPRTATLSNSAIEDFIYRDFYGYINTNNQPYIRCGGFYGGVDKNDPRIIRINYPCLRKDPFIGKKL